MKNYRARLHADRMHDLGTSGCLKSNQPTNPQLIYALTHTQTVAIVPLLWLSSLAFMTTSTAHHAIETATSTTYHRPLLPILSISHRSASTSPSPNPNSRLRCCHPPTRIARGPDLPSELAAYVALEKSSLRGLMISGPRQVERRSQAKKHALIDSGRSTQVI